MIVNVGLRRYSGDGDEEVNAEAILTEDGEELTTEDGQTLEQG